MQVEKKKSFKYLHIVKVHQHFQADEFLNLFHFFSLLVTSSQYLTKVK